MCNAFGRCSNAAFARKMNKWFITFGRRANYVLWRYDLWCPQLIRNYPKDTLEDNTRQASRHAGTKISPRVNSNILFYITYQSPTQNTNKQLIKKSKIGTQEIAHFCIPCISLSPTKTRINWCKDAWWFLYSCAMFWQLWTKHLLPTTNNVQFFFVIVLTIDGFFQSFLNLLNLLRQCSRVTGHHLDSHE